MRHCQEDEEDDDSNNDSKYAPIPTALKHITCQDATRLCAALTLSPYAATCLKVGCNELGDEVIALIYVSEWDQDL